MQPPLSKYGCAAISGRAHLFNCVSQSHSCLLLNPPRWFPWPLQVGPVAGFGYLAATGLDVFRGAQTQLSFGAGGSSGGVHHRLD
jgi:hypothetical protein